MTNFDKTIQDALASIGFSHCICLWMPSGDRPNEFVLSIPEEFVYPCCLQAAEDEQEQLENGNVARYINFYMFEQLSPVNIDVLNELNPIYERMTSAAIAFVDYINNYYKCNFEGRIKKEHHTMANTEAGISFTLKIEYVPCSIETI